MPTLLGTALIAGLTVWAAQRAATGPLAAAPSDKGEAPPIAPLDPSRPLRIELTGADRRWRVRYAGGDGRFGTADDRLTSRQVRVPLDVKVELTLHSDDYVYTLSLPRFGLKEIAVPGLAFQLAFRPTAAGEFELRGDQLCGEPHPDLLGSLVVLPRDRFEAWLQSSSQDLPN